MVMNRARKVLSALLLFGAAHTTFAQYPARPIRLVVPFPAGESVDATARLVGQSWSAAIGQQILVDNRGGAGGTIGSEAVAKSPPDGYTLLWRSEERRVGKEGRSRWSSGDGSRQTGYA